MTIAQVYMVKTNHDWGFNSKYWLCIWLFSGGEWLNSDAFLTLLGGLEFRELNILIERKRRKNVRPSFIQRWV